MNKQNNNKVDEEEVVEKLEQQAGKVAGQISRKLLLNFLSALVGFALSVIPILLICIIILVIVHYNNSIWNYIIR